MAEVCARSRHGPRGARKIPRSIYEGARDAARALAGSKAFEQSCRDRKRVEMLFAHLKRILRLGRLRLRGFAAILDDPASGAQRLKRALDSQEDPEFASGAQTGGNDLFSWARETTLAPMSLFQHLIAADDTKH